jgi:hypothetical protein
VIVDAAVWIWTKDGMRRASETAGVTRYIEVSEAERLLEEAHRRGNEQARATEPSCAHSHLPGGLGCVVCEVNAFENRFGRLR